MLHFLSFNFRDDNLSRNGILLDVPENANFAEIETELHTKFRSSFLPADLILLRFPPWIMRKPMPSDDELSGITGISNRFPNASVRILSSHNYQHLIGENLSETFTADFAFENNIEPFINQLRNDELLEIVRKSEGIFTAGSNYTFRLPSRAFSNSFLRVGNIQTSRHNLDTLFFWMIPYLCGVKGILVDTWSISSIALNCSRLMARYNPEEQNGLRVEMRGSYVDGKDETRSQLLELIKHVSLDFSSPFLSIFSAAMTGRSMQNLISVLDANQYSHDLIQFLVLFRLGGNGVNINGKLVPELCNLSKSGLSEFSDQNQSRETVIEIDRTTYFPVFVKEKEIKLTKVVALENSSFFKRYGLSNGIRIHRDSQVGGQFYRHHGIYIDVFELIQQSQFKEQLNTILQKYFEPPKMVIVPPHKAGVAFAKVVVSHFQRVNGYCPEILVHLDLGYPASNDIESHDHLEMDEYHQKLKSFTESDLIMVLDDVVTTGSRLLTYQKRLRDIEYKGQICYLVGVQRMPSRDKFETLSSTLKQNNLGKSHTLEYVESVLLPDWNSDDCPLCVEKDLLSEIIKGKSNQYSAWTNERFQLLNNSTDSGLSDNVFLQLSGTSPLQLSINSFIADKNAPQSVVLGSVAAAIQEMRENENPKKRLDARGFPFRTVFAAADLDRYSDGILRASILRSLVPEELRRIAHDKESSLIEWGTTLFKSKGQDDQNTLPELALAIGLRKLPIEIASKKTKQVLKETGRNDLLSIMLPG